MTRLILAFVLVIASAFHAQAGTVKNDLGGVIVEYHRAVEAVRASGEKIRFDGMCASACTLYLSLPKSQLCVTPRAKFGFHAAISPDEKVRKFFTRSMFEAYPAWVRAWVKANGGLTTRNIVMPHAVAIRHIPSC